MRFERTRRRLKRMPLWQKSLGAALLTTPFLLTASFVTWFLSFHGSTGFFEVVSYVRYTVYGLFGFSVLVPLAAACLMPQRERVRSRGGERAAKALSCIIWGLVALAVLVPVAGLVFLGLTPLGRAGDKPAQLLLSGTTGARGIPDMAVSYWTEKSTAVSFSWGAEGSRGNVSRAGPSNAHAFPMQDLEPGARYWYRIGDGPVRRFTAPPSNGPLRFAVSSDCHYGSLNSDNAATRAVMRQVADPGRFDAFFLLGDVVEYGFDDRNWLEMTRELSPYTGVVPTRPLPGNHDTLIGGLDLYRDYSSPPTARSVGSPLWYRVDVGKVHFFCLDLEWTTDTYTEEQRRWFERELPSVPRGDWTIVMSHCFYYSSGSFKAGWRWYDDKEMIDTFSPLFEKYGVDLVCSGHNHNMELLRSNGVTYAVVGAFGGKPEPSPTYISPASVWRRYGEFGFVDVSILGENGTVTFRDTGGRELGRFAFENRGAR